MNPSESYKNKIFIVSDPDCRIRNSTNLLEYKVGNGIIATIPKNSSINITDVRIVPIGTNHRLVFGFVISTAGEALGWTSTRNLEGGFINETLGAILPKANANKYGINSAWSKGSYIGQKILIMIVDRTQDVEYITAETLPFYIDLVTSARNDGIEIAINSAFRSYSEQKVLYEGHQKGLPGFNLAAKPGQSNHQSGIAFDIPVAGGKGNAVYDWLVKHGPQHGFLRTVPSEPWHWEHLPAEAPAAIAAHKFSTY